jgi:von Willebrand factor type A domain
VGSISFLTPFAALVALGGVLPLAAFLERERRARLVRKTLHLVDPAPGPGRWLLAALIAVPVLAGVAAAQPVIDRSTPVQERADAEIFFVLDVSRSMLAADGPEEPTRFERARAAALEVRQRLPGVPAGIAQMTDLTVPHLFPTSNASTFRSTLTRSIGAGALGSRSNAILATDLSALGSFARANFFSRGVRKRLLVVLTDGETEKVEPGLASLPRSGIRSLFVHVWGADEAIFQPSGAEPQYRPDPTSERSLAEVAELVDGAVFDEDDVGGVVAQARRELGEGPSRPRKQRDLFALMPYVTLAAAVPLALVLRRRNL